MGYEVTRGETVLTKQNDLVISSSKLVCASWRWWQDLAVSAVTGMNGPVVAGHSAAVQQGLFNQLNDRQADGRWANHRHSALAAVMMPIQPDQRAHMMRAEGRVGERGRRKSMSASTARSPPGWVFLPLFSVSHLYMSLIFFTSLTVPSCLLFQHFSVVFLLP